MRSQSPVRVVLDSGLRLPLEHCLVAFARETPLWILAAQSAPKDKEQDLRAAGVEVLRVGRAGDGVDLKKALEALAGKGITRLLVEPGPTIAASFLKADLIDEAVILRAPVNLGADAVDAIAGASLNGLTSSMHYRMLMQDELGADQMTIYERT
jgi:diaminohydroxyphosphoribosylaminopyrimidine deaminase/5-amino-6-(5-phosphoribosylamino)uracil reductase